MNWLFELHQAQPIAHAIGVLAFVCVAGMALGSVKVKGVGLGTAGVLFAGIIVGHFGKAVDHHTLDFVKEFGLTFEVLHDPKQVTTRNYQITGYPETFIIARDGTIRKKLIGASDWSSEGNRALVRELLGGTTASR